MDNNNLNQTVSRSTSAASSFRTFILTLSISLIVFSVVYYFMSSSGNSLEVFENSLSDRSVSEVTEEEVQGIKSESIFGEIAAKDPDTQARFVLAGADEVDETTQSTTSVPETGIFSVTVGLISATVLFLVGLIVISSNPRKLALNTFEKSVTKDLD